MFRVSLGGLPLVRRRRADERQRQGASNVPWPPVPAFLADLHRFVERRAMVFAPSRALVKPARSLLGHTLWLVYGEIQPVQ
jgi:hypothetical protein